MPGNRRLLLACSQDQELDLKVPGWDLIPLAVNRVVPIPAPWPGTCDAVVVTSRHAVPWLSQAVQGFSGPVGVSGPATASRVREAGFRVRLPQDRGGEGALRALELPAGSRVLFPCGAQTAGAVERLAESLGIELVRQEVYRLEPCEASLEALPEGTEGVVFLSGQMVRHFHSSASPSFFGTLSGLPALCTQTARVQLQSLGWKGPLVELEKKSGQLDLSRLLLEAVLSQEPSGARDAAHIGGIASDSGGAEMTGPS